MSMLPQIAFFGLSALALASSIMVITRRNAVHSVIWLIVTLFSVAGIFLMLQAEFLFAVQIILYVGGIMVLFLFVIMLVNLDLLATQKPFNRQGILALATAVILLAELGYAIFVGRDGFSLASAAGGSASQGNTQTIAMMLYQNYMLPVEIASLLLLVAMIGAVIMAKRKLE